MRHVLLVVLGLFLGAVCAHVVVARADDAAPAPAPSPQDPSVRMDAMLARFERETAVLRAEVDYLRSREASMSKYVLSMATAAASVRTRVAEARAAGFEAAAVPASSRVAVLRALDQLAGDLSSALPAPSANEVALQHKIEELRRVAGWK